MIGSIAKTVSLLKSRRYFFSIALSTFNTLEKKYQYRHTDTFEPNKVHIIMRYLCNISPPFRHTYTFEPNKVHIIMRYLCNISPSTHLVATCKRQSVS